MSDFLTLFPPDHPGGAFRDPPHLIGWLQSDGPHPETKNLVLARTLGGACRDDSAGALAVEILILALWPGLCVVRRRLRSLCRTEALEADLVSGLAIGIRAARPEKVRRVAATLLRNLERDLRRAYIGEDRYAVTDLDIDRIGHTLAGQEADRPEAILAAARQALGLDGVLLVAVHVLGLTQKQAAERLGLSHDAVRKRCQRAMARLRQHSDA